MEIKKAHVAIAVLVASFLVSIGFNISYKLEINKLRTQVLDIESRQVPPPPQAPALPPPQLKRKKTRKISEVSNNISKKRSNNGQFSIDSDQLNKIQLKKVVRSSNSKLSKKGLSKILLDTKNKLKKRNSNLNSGIPKHFRPEEGTVAAQIWDAMSKRRGAIRTDSSLSQEGAVENDDWSDDDLVQSGEFVGNENVQAGCYDNLSEDAKNSINQKILKMNLEEQ